VLSSLDDRRHKLFFSLLIFFCFTVILWKLTLMGRGIKEGSIAGATAATASATVAVKHDDSAPSINTTVTINTIALIGERNSGTTWMFEELQRCYENSFTVLNHLTRHKHWFQYDDEKQHNRTLVVAEFRSPYQYVLAMIDKPRRALAHRQMDWYTFVTTPWTTERAASDLQYANSTGRVCRAGFTYDEVVACEKNPAPDEYLTHKPLRAQKNNTQLHKQSIQDIPVYELRRDGSGLPYSSIVDMRADKIRNHVLEVRDFPFVEDVVVVRYEDLLQQGTASLLDKITELTGARPHCKAVPPQPDRPQRPVTADFKKWMDEHVDWEAEALIGYNKY